MSLWTQIRERRITQILLSYLVGGWIILQVVDQLVDRDVLPRYVYVVALILFGFGIPAALVIGWYHGEKGDQRVAPLEVALLGVLALAAGASAFWVVRDARVLLRAQEGGVELNRIAVLYFTGEDEETTLVGAGLTEDLIARLSRVPELDVISRNGAREVRDREMGVYEAGEYLDVGALLEGDVRRSGDELVVAVRILTRDDVRLGNVSVWGPADDAVALQNAVSAEVEEAFRSRLGKEIRFRESRSAAPNNGAFLALARGEQALQRALSASDQGDDIEAAARFQEGERALEEASELAEDWAEPWLLRSRSVYERARRTAETPEDAARFLDESVRLADGALDRDPTSAEALNRRGTARYVRFLMGLDETPEARSETLRLAQEDLEAAVERDNTLAEAYSTLSHLYYQVEDPASAALAAQRAYETDAFLTAADAVLRRLFSANYDLARTDRAREWCLEGRRRFPLDHFFLECQLFVMTMDGADPQPFRAWEIFDSIRDLTAGGWEAVEPWELQVVGGILARAGLADSASAVMARGHRGPREDPTGELLPLEAAMRLLNDQEGEALSLLQEYTADAAGHFGQGQSLHWWWRKLEGNPDFERLRRLN